MKRARQSSAASPVVSITRRATFAASHRLHSKSLTAKENEEVYGKCNRKCGHGHNYTVFVTLRGTIDADTGMLYNLADLKVAMQRVLEQCDHRNLDVEWAALAARPSTVENVCVAFYEQLAKHSNALAKLLHSVRVLETENNSAEYFGPAGC